MKDTTISYSKNVLYFCLTCKIFILFFLKKYVWGIFGLIPPANNKFAGIYTEVHKC